MQQVSFWGRHKTEIKQTFIRVHFRCLTKQAKEMNWFEPAKPEILQKADEKCRGNERTKEDRILKGRRVFQKCVPITNNESKKLSLI